MIEEGIRQASACRQMGIEPGTPRRWAVGSEKLAVVREATEQALVEGAAEAMPTARKRSMGVAPFTGILRCAICKGPMVTSGNNAQVGRCYGCAERKYAYQGRRILHGEFALIHEPNTISEVKVVRQVRGLLARITEADMRDYVRSLGEIEQAGVQTQRELLLRAERENRQKRADELSAELERALFDSVRDVLRQSLVVEMKALADIDAELAQMNAAITVDEDEVVREMLALAKDESRWDLPPEELAAILRRALPALWVRRGFMALKLTDFTEITCGMLQTL